MRVGLGDSSLALELIENDLKCFYHKGGEKSKIPIPIKIDSIPAEIFAT